jgi:taurine transport system permease protein
MSDERTKNSGGMFSGLTKAKPAKPGEIYGVPGQGESFKISAVVIVLLISLWGFVTHAGYIKPLFLPSPLGVIQALLDVMKEGFTGVGFWEHIWVSTLRVFGAFVLACVIGIPLGIAMGMSPIARGIFDPPIEFYRPIPPLAYLPLMIIWFGIDELSKVLLIFSSVLAPMVLGARAGVKSAAIEQIHAAYSFGATRWQVIRMVVLPSAMPEIFTAMRVGLVLGGPHWWPRKWLRPPRVWATWFYRRRGSCKPPL